MSYIDPTHGIVEIDKLSYLYNPSQLDFGQAAAPGSTYPVSRLVGVKDEAPGEPAVLGFNQGDVTNGQNGTNGNAYSYDGAGNMTYDPYKDITIDYNHLNLPKSMGEFDIVYDATGRKWMQKGASETLIYIGGLLIRDGHFASLQLADGRIFYDDQKQKLFSEYHHKDHLGNVRVAFTDYDNDGIINLTDANSGEVSQVNTYYPFGLVHEQNCGPDGVVGNENRWTYNNMELENSLNIYLASSRSRVFRLMCAVRA